MHIDAFCENGKLIPAVTDPRNLRSLKVVQRRRGSLRPVAQLYQLTTLEVFSFLDETLDVLRKLKQLHYLRIIHLPNVTDLSPLADLRELECLSLSTLPSWDASGKVTVVESLDPIGQLQDLRHVELMGVRPKSKSLSPLERCPRLASARFHKYPKRELERFYAAKRVSDAFVPEPVFDTG
jgi:hypothetical protein